MMVSMAAITAVMAVSFVFGYFLRGIINKEINDPNNADYEIPADDIDWQDEQHRCDNCAFRNTAIYDVPCVDCVDFDEWIQEGEETDDLCKD